MNEWDMLAWHSCHSRLFRLLPLTMHSSAFRLKKAPGVVRLKILRFISAFSPDSMAVSVFFLRQGLYTS